MLKFSCFAATKTAGKAINKANFELGGKCAPMSHRDFSAAYEGDSKEPFIAAVADAADNVENAKYASFMVCRNLAYTDENLPVDPTVCAENMSEAILNSNDIIRDMINKGKTGHTGISIASALFAGGAMRYTNLGNTGIYLLRGGKFIKLTDGNAAYKRITRSNDFGGADSFPAKTEKTGNVESFSENTEYHGTKEDNSQPIISVSESTEWDDPLFSGFYENYEDGESMEYPKPDSEFLLKNKQTIGEEFSSDGRTMRSLPEYQDIRLLKGDKILICGENIASFVPKSELKAILSAAGSAEDRLGALMITANEYGSSGDLTAVIIEVGRKNGFAAFLGGMNAARYIGLALIISAVIFILVQYLPELTRRPPADTDLTPSPTASYLPVLSPTSGVVITGAEEKTPIPTPSAAVSFNTAVPSPTPVNTDEPMPSVAPTPTPVPTAVPTPTPIPIVIPTVMPPTEQPTSTPTAEPTSTPTAEPTLTPTAEPTLTPTAEPTSTPTAEPTSTPTAEPPAEP